MTTIPSFPETFALRTLRQAGWPKTRGFRAKEEFVDLNALDDARESLAQTGVAIGYGKPELALRLLSASFLSRDWIANSGDELLNELDRSREINVDSEEWPWGVITEPALASDDDEANLRQWAFVFEERFHDLLHAEFAQSLVWGLLHPDAAREALQSHGMTIGTAGGNVDSIVQRSVANVLAYEAEFGSLSVAVLPLVRTERLALRVREAPLLAQNPSTRFAPSVRTSDKRSLIVWNWIMIIFAILGGLAMLTRPQTYPFGFAFDLSVWLGTCGLIYLTGYALLGLVGAARNRVSSPPRQ